MADKDHDGNINFHEFCRIMTLKWYTYILLTELSKNALGGDRTHDRWLIRPTL